MHLIEEIEMDVSSSVRLFSCSALAMTLGFDLRILLIPSLTDRPFVDSSIV